MNHSKYALLAITLILATLVITGCGTPQAAACPTSAAQSCPTAAAQVQPTMDAWRNLYNDMHTNVRITFDAGKKCSMDILTPSQPQAGEFIYEIIVNDNTYSNYMVGAGALAEGHTKADLEAYNESNTGKVAPPSFFDLESLDIVPPMSRTWHGAPITASQIYFICFIEGPDPQTGIQVLGPVDVAQ